MRRIYAPCQDTEVLIIAFELCHLAKHEQAQQAFGAVAVSQVEAMR